MKLGIGTLATASLLLVAACGGDGGNGSSGLAGAGVFEGVYDVTFQADIVITDPSGVPDIAHSAPEIFTIADGTASDAVITSVSARTGGQCTFAINRTGDTTAAIAPDQSCTTLFDSNDFGTVTLFGTFAVSGNTLTGQGAGDVTGTRAGAAFVGNYTGVWQGTKRP